MNVHHLELFYYVARYGGIMEAVRNMPYGIQQPAISGQLLQLESHLGVKLFRRRPFELLPAGTELYEFIYPFFGGLGGMEKRLRSASRETLRVAAPVLALRDHLPRVLQEVRKHFPHLQLTLRAGQQPQVEAWLERQELDFAITLLEGQGAKGLQHLPLLELPLVLLVPKTSRFRNASEIFDALATESLEDPLISITATELAPRRFREFLESRSLEWPSRVEVTDLELVEVYVQNGFGIGLGLAIPGSSTAKDLRVLPITDIAPLLLGAVWQGALTAVMSTLIETLRSHVQKITGTLPPPAEIPPRRSNH
ncbi:MAG: LysR family transcriptional regulator [Limisphaerales bacterium]|jgi:DNA-binding transcriptional LysR family regulator